MDKHNRLLNELFPPKACPVEDPVFEAALRSLRSTRRQRKLKRAALISLPILALLAGAWITRFPRHGMATVFPCAIVSTSPNTSLMRVQTAPYQTTLALTTHGSRSVTTEGQPRLYRIIDGNELLRFVNLRGAMLVEIAPQTQILNLPEDSKNLLR